MKYRDSQVICLLDERKTFLEECAGLRRIALPKKLC